ncbi:hypothetical protein MIMGU_mgv1a020324mg [Erythranthe guttata]|uniref:Uncharacterized protein n=1 Tax=Erythranthe guttata TaxID=4155 RepID=A0A022Q6B5_ERYGU|nr:hypothetical protein MIMGU_mgv1a020324mg [Erythranthe guttata]
MQQAHRIGVQITAEATEVIAAESVLVPPQEWWQRALLVNPHPLLKLHPLDNLCGIISGPPSLEIDHHKSGVERERRAGPERRCEVDSEVGVAVLRGRQHGLVRERRCRNFRDVVNEDEVGVEVDYPSKRGSMGISPPSSTAAEHHRRAVPSSTAVEC